jgi:hypothetical protein
MAEATRTGIPHKTRLNAPPGSPENGLTEWKTRPTKTEGVAYTYLSTEGVTHEKQAKLIKKRY